MEMGILIYFSCGRDGIAIGLIFFLVFSITRPWRSCSVMMSDHSSID
jgi:hypothetical protein